MPHTWGLLAATVRGVFWWIVDCNGNWLPWEEDNQYVCYISLDKISQNFLLVFTTSQLVTQGKETDVKLGWWQREDTTAQRLHLKAEEGVKQGEKTGNYSDKCVESLGRMVQQGDSVVGACWEMHAGSRLGQTPQEWFCWNKTSDFALILGNPGSSTVLMVNEKQQQELPEKGKGGKPEPYAETAGSIQQLKGRR